MCSPIPIARSIMISRRFSTFECWRCQEVETTIDGDDSGWEGYKDPEIEPGCYYIYRRLSIRNHSLTQRTVNIYHTRQARACKINTDEPWRLAGVVEGREEGPGAARTD